MGIDPAPQMANLYLYYYEAKLMEMLTKENYSAAKKFNYTRRFIDALHTLNNDGHLEENNNMGRIYPQELKLNQENQNDDFLEFWILELPFFTYHTYYTSKQMYNWMKWLQLLGGWHFIAATAIKPPKAACQFAADDILLYEFCYYNPMDYFTIWKKEEKNCHHYNTILSLYISYQDITRRVC